MPRGRRAVALVAATVTALAVAVAVVLVVQEDEPRHVRAAATPSVTAPPIFKPRKATAPIGVPDRLVISSIGVDAPVLPVGTTPEGAQEVPSSLEATGWWRDGQQPGSAGNAVIVGHTASAADGVFDDLVELDEGDTITVSSGSESLSYAVTREEAVEVADFASVADEIYRETGPSGLVLMTCGDWNGTEFETTVIIHAEVAQQS